MSVVRAGSDQKSVARRSTFIPRRMKTEFRSDSVWPSSTVKGLDPSTADIHQCHRCRAVPASIRPGHQAIREFGDQRDSLAATLFDRLSWQGFGLGERLGYGWLGHRFWRGNGC